MAIDPKILLRQLEIGLQELRREYDFYFNGQRKLEPVSERKEIEHVIRQLVNMRMKNTADQFKLNSLTGSWSTHKTQWDRILLLIERGAYKRDKFLADLHGHKKAVAGSTSEAIPEAVYAEDDAPPPPRPAAIERPKDAVAVLYEQFVRARQGTPEGSAQPSLDNFRQTIARQHAALREKHGDKKVKFKVVVEEGKAKLKASLSD